MGESARPICAESSFSLRDRWSAHHRVGSSRVRTADERKGRKKQEFFFLYFPASSFASCSPQMAHFTDLIDIAAERLGGAVLLANDEFFAPKESLLKATPAVWKEGEYTDRGKWMDGWETRRRREPGHDWCIIRLGLPGAIHGVVVDTAFFRGNYPESCSIEATVVEGTPTPAELTNEKHTRWREILPKAPLKGDSKNEF